MTASKFNNNKKHGEEKQSHDERNKRPTAMYGDTFNDEQFVL